MLGSYRIFLLALTVYILNFTVTGELIKEVILKLRDTQTNIGNDIRRNHFYLYYLHNILGISFLLGVILVGTIFTSSSQLAEVVGAIGMAFILVSFYKLIVTRYIYSKYNDNVFTPSKSRGPSFNSITKRYYHSTSTREVFSGFVAEKSGCRLS